MLDQSEVWMVSPLAVLVLGGIALAGVAILATVVVQLVRLLGRRGPARAWEPPADLPPANPRTGQDNDPRIQARPNR